MKTNLPKGTPGENESLAGILKNEAQRYREKGVVATTVAAVLFAAYFYIMPIVLKQIWPAIVAIGNKNVVMIGFVVLLPFLIVCLGNILFYFIYIGKFKFFEQYRITQGAWPWEEDAAAWRKTLNKSITRIVVNTFCIQLPLTAVLAYIIGLNQYKFSFESFPNHMEMIWHFCVMFVCEDIAGYVGHRTMHVPFFYKRFHKVHHEHGNTVAIAATYSHPVEFVSTNTPAVFGFVLLGSSAHFATLLMWIIFRMVETIEAHSGYEFTWSPIKVLPFSCSSEYHSYHHSHNVGTFGAFFIFMDTILKTNNDFFLHKTKIDSVKEKQRLENIEKKSS